MINKENSMNKKVTSLFPKVYFCVKDSMVLNAKTPKGGIDRYVNLFTNDIQRIMIDGTRTLKEVLCDNSLKFYSGLNGKNIIPINVLIKISDTLSTDFYEKISKNNVEESILWRQFDLNKGEKIAAKKVIEWYSAHLLNPTDDFAYKILASNDYNDEFRNFLLLLATLFGDKLYRIKDIIKGLHKALNDETIHVNSYDGYYSIPHDSCQSEIAIQILRFNDHFNTNADIQQFYNNLELFFRYSLYCKSGEKINGYEAGTKLKNISDMGSVYQIVQYFTFFEAIYIYLNVNGEPFDMIDDLFRYRFMVAANNPLVQKEELFPMIGSYSNICNLYEKWSTAIERKEKTYAYEANKIYFGEFNLPDSYIAYKFVKMGYKQQTFTRNEIPLFVEKMNDSEFCVRNIDDSISAHLEFEANDDNIRITSFESKYDDKTLRMMPILLLVVQWVELINISYKCINIEEKLIGEDSGEDFINAGFKKAEDDSKCWIWDNLLYNTNDQ